MISEDIAIDIVRKAIKTEEGWQRLAKSLNNSIVSKNQCIEILKKIGANKAVNVFDDGGYSTAVDLSEMLIAKLDSLTPDIK